MSVVEFKPEANKVFCDALRKYTLEGRNVNYNNVTDAIPVVIGCLEAMLTEMIADTKDVELQRMLRIKLVQLEKTFDTYQEFSIVIAKAVMKVG